MHLTSALAAHPALTPALRAALVDRAGDPATPTGAARGILTALMSNPATARADLPALSSRARGSLGWAAAASAALQRPDMDDQTVLALLGPTPSAALLHLALGSVPDPRGALTAALVTAADTCAAHVRDALLADPATPAPVLRTALLAHVRDQPAGIDLRRVTDHLARLVATATTTEQRSDALTFVAAVRAVAVDGPVRGALDQLLADAPQPPTGSKLWIAAPSTTLDELRAWARDPDAPGRPTSLAGRWHKVVTCRPDPDGSVAADAWAHAGPYLLLAPAVVTSRAPLDVRLAAVAEQAHIDGNLPAATTDLLRACPVDAAVAFAAHDAHADVVLTVASRTDLTDEHLHALLATFRAGAPRPAGRSWPVRGIVGAWLATHPGAAPSTRALGLELTTGPDAALPLGGGQPCSGTLTAWHTLARIAVAGTHAAPDLPVPDVNSDPGMVRAGRDRLVAAALDQLLPQVTTPTTARTLLTLAGTFTGTLADLFAVAQTVSD